MTFDELLPPHVRERIPPMYSTEGQNDIVVSVHLFFPGFWDWYLIELDVEEHLAFALVKGWEIELGLVDIDELLATRDKLGNNIELDLYFQPISLKILKQKLQSQ